MRESVDRACGETNQLNDGFEGESPRGPFQRLCVGSPEMFDSLSVPSQLSKRLYAVSRCNKFHL